MGHAAAMDEVPVNTGNRGSDERDPWGRFQPGNQAGKAGGHKRIAVIRRAFLACVTPLEVQAVYRAIFAGVLNGDAAMARLWAEYCLGKPKHVADEEGEDAAPMVIAPPEPIANTA